MIKCKKCGKIMNNPAGSCEECSTPIQLSKQEVSEILREIEESLEKNDFTKVVDLHKLLADAGTLEGERGLALILERGILLPRDLENAAKYYYAAAQKGDPFSAYRYSRLVVGNESRADFWLAYAAIMECEESYADAFNLYARYKDRESAAYYCSRLADKGDIDAVMEMARRHLYGDGVAQDERQAKWYAERIERAPLHALKLHRRLISLEEKSVRPKKVTFTKRNRIIERLIHGARKFGYTKVLLSLSKLYANEKTPDASVYLAFLHIDGIEFEKNPELGVSMLEEAMENGSIAAAKHLGDIYAVGAQVEPDAKRAIHYYRRAADMGGDGFLEELGDVFHSDELCEADYALAYALYKKGAKAGEYRCEAKLRAMNEEREKNYLNAVKIERTSPEEAFDLYKRSVDAGYLPAHARIGWYYERGIGTKIDRKAAFTHYKAAYDAGDKRAIESLGRCYARGIGTAFNFKAASDLLSIAREMGSHSADKELYRIYENKKRHMLRSLYSTAMRLYYNKKYDVAKQMLETCMQMGLGDATYAIGCLYEFGITTAPDRKIALRFYKKAYEQGYSDPRQYHKQSMLRIWK